MCTAHLGHLARISECIMTWIGSIISATCKVSLLTVFCIGGSHAFFDETAGIVTVHHRCLASGITNNSCAPHLGKLKGRWMCHSKATGFELRPPSSITACSRTSRMFGNELCQVPHSFRADLETRQCESYLLQPIP